MWYPTWALGRSGVSHDEPAQAVDDRNVVVTVNQAAADAGVTVGMQRRAAEVLCPAIVTIETDHAADMARFELVVERLESIVPRVEIGEPGLVFIPTAGAVSYYGDERKLIDRIDEELASMGTGDGYRVGIAGAPFTAREAARAASQTEHVFVVEDEDAFRESLDVSTIAGEDLVAVFRWLGITTLGALAALPHHAVASRFGRAGMEAHRTAMGATRAVHPRDVPEDRTVEVSFDPPLEDLERASFAARSLARELVDALAADGSAPYKVVVTVVASDGTTRIRTWMSPDPFDVAMLAERVRWQLRAWTEGPSSGGIGGGIASLRLEPADVSDGGRQLALGEDAGGIGAAQRAIAEVQAIAGPDNVLVASPQGGRDPAQRVSWTRWGVEARTAVRDVSAPWPGRIPGPSPSLVPPDPIPFTVTWSDGTPEQVRLRSRWVPVLSWAGPWRYVGRWWDGEGNAERYQIVTSAGAYLCEVRDGVTYLLGVYD